MTTKIGFNGSRWLGQEPATVDELVELLAREPLDPKFEHYGDFCSQIDGPFAECAEVRASGVCFHGNFLRVSHAFSIVTDDPEVEARLFAAILENKKSAAYLAARPEARASCRCKACLPEVDGPRAKPLSASRRR